MQFPFLKFNVCLPFCPLLYFVVPNISFPVMLCGISIDRLLVINIHPCASWWWRCQRLAYPPTCSFYFWHLIQQQNALHTHTKIINKIWQTLSYVFLVKRQLLNSRAGKLKHKLFVMRYFPKVKRTIMMLTF